MSTAYRTTRAIETPSLRDRIIVDGVDVTTIRGHRTHRPGYTLVEPFAYGSSRPLVFPQYNPLHEAIPTWAHTGAVVLYQSVDAADNVVATNYRGVVTTIGITGPVLTLEVGGDLVARAELLERQPPVFRSVRDIGAMMHDYVRQTLNQRFTPKRAPGGGAVGPTTGIQLLATGGMTGLGYLQHLCTQAQTPAGDQWTLMPTEWGGKEWTFRLKDRTTIDYTIFLDDARIVADLNDDASESPNVWYGSCINPNGAIERGARYPGLVQGTPPPYPPEAGASFGVGTTNNDLGGDGVTIMNNRLLDMGYIDRIDIHNGLFNDATERAVNRLRRDAGMPRNGLMNEELWDALFDLSVTGPDLSGAQIFPILEADEVRDWNYTATGALKSKNPEFDAGVLRVERTIDFGNLTTAKMIDWFQGRQEISESPNWAGTIRLAEGVGVLAGEWQPGDTPGPEDLVRASAIRPGTNAWLPFPGILVHIPEVNLDGDTTLNVDCRARDWLELREVLERRRESRRDPRREWRRENRRGQSIHDAKMVWDRWAGRLTNPVDLPADEWTVTPIIAGQIGTVSQLLTRVKPAAEYVITVFGAAPGAGGDLDNRCKKLARALNNLFPNPWPINDSGETAWETDHQDWLDRMQLLYASGDEEEPCGYGNRRHTNRDGQTTDAPLTGKHRDRSGFEYATGNEPVVYLAILPKAETVLQPGRVLRKREEDSA